MTRRQYIEWDKDTANCYICGRLFLALGGAVCCHECRERERYLDETEREIRYRVGRGMSPEVYRDD